MKSQEVLKILSKEHTFPKEVAILQTASGDFIDFMSIENGYRKEEILSKIKRMKKHIDSYK